MEDHVVRALDLPVRARVRYGSPINADVVVIAELEEFIPHELCAIVGYDGVWDPDRWMMSVKNNTACSDLITVIGRASIHFVNLSTVTSKCVKP